MSGKLPTSLFSSDELSAGAAEQLRAYGELLSSLGTRLGLIHLSREQIREQVGRSLALAALVVDVARESGRSVTSCIDVGSGAGLPAVPLCIGLTEILGEGAPHIAMVEPRRKAIGFLEKVVRQLSLECTIVPARAEAAAKGKWRSQGDFVTAKALAQPKRALVLCAPLCKIGGVIVLTGRSETSVLIQDLSAAEFRRLGLRAPSGRLVSGPQAVSQVVHVVFKESDPESHGTPTSPGGK